MEVVGQRLVLMMAALVNHGMRMMANIGRCSVMGMLQLARMRNVLGVRPSFSRDRMLHVALVPGKRHRMFVVAAGGAGRFAVVASASSRSLFQAARNIVLVGDPVRADRLGSMVLPAACAVDEVGPNPTGVSVAKAYLEPSIAPAGHHDPGAIFDYADPVAL